MLDWKECPWCFGLGRWQTGETCNVKPDAHIVRCDECGFEAPCPPNKPFDPCPNCPECDKCGHRPDGKFRLMFDYPSGKPSIYEAKEESK